MKWSGKNVFLYLRHLSIPDQIVQNIPSPGMATATVAVAVVATTSALLAKPLADLLLKVVKPAVKKVMKKVATLRGKKIPYAVYRGRSVRGAADTESRGSETEEIGRNRM